MYTNPRQRDMILVYRMAKIPWPLFFLICFVVAIGAAILYSAAKGNVDPWASRHLIRFGVGVPMMIAIAMIDIRIWFKCAYLMYAGAVLLLVAVEVLGVEGGLGAQRWLNIAGFQFQPSEFMKVALVVAVARYYHVLHISHTRPWWSIAVPAAFIGVAALLILKQPNLGTAGIILMLGTILLFLAGVNWKLFVLGAILLGAAIPVAWNHVLHDYQKQRVYTFLNPESDPLGAGYNIIQSKIAIGSGGLTGKGFVEGSQSQLAFVPERQTDFIFSILAEEFGLMGGVGIIALYAFIIYYCLFIALRCDSTFARLIAMGMASILFLHVFINIGMVMGILPVVGVPLPLMSYGGSSMLSTMIAFGFVFNAYVHRNRKLRTRSVYSADS